MRMRAAASSELCAGRLVLVARPQVQAGLVAWRGVAYDAPISTILRRARAVERADQGQAKDVVRECTTAVDDSINSRCLRAITSGGAVPSYRALPPAANKATISRLKAGI